jgi:hypothetical protein
MLGHVHFEQYPPSRINLHDRPLQPSFTLHPPTHVHNPYLLYLSAPSLPILLNPRTPIHFTDIALQSTMTKLACPTYRYLRFSLLHKATSDTERIVKSLLPLDSETKKLNLM